MKETVNITIRMDAKMKEDAEKLFNELGMNMTTAINIFIRQAIRDNGIPFKINATNKNHYSYSDLDEDDDISELF